MHIFQPNCQLYYPSPAASGSVRFDRKFPSLPEGSARKACAVMRVERLRVSNGNDGTSEKLRHVDSRGNRLVALTARNNLALKPRDLH